MHSPQDKLLGKRLREVRQSKEMTQELVAFTSGINRVSLSYIEHGKRRVTAAELTILAEILEEPILYLITGDRNTPATYPF